MPHSYRKFQHWDHWLAHHSLGKYLLDAEQEKLTTLLNRHFGKQAVLIGVPNQYNLLNATQLPCFTLISSLFNHDKKVSHLETNVNELPILTGSVDLVLLPHTLELLDNPRQLLTEACRIIKPEGLIVIIGFNPYSLWGLRKLLIKKKITPWTNNFISPNSIKKWLALADFMLEKQTFLIYRPPFSHKKLDTKLNFFEKIGKWCFPIFGGEYILIARAKMIPLTPIKLKWKQELSGVRISPTISGAR